MSLFSLGSLGEGGGGGVSMFLKAELYSIKMVNSTGEKSRVRGVITKWEGGGGGTYRSLSSYQ